MKHLTENTDYFFAKINIIKRHYIRQDPAPDCLMFAFSPHLCYNFLSGEDYYMEISQEQQQKLALLALQHQLEMILLFGSAVSGRQHPHSDMDIAVLRKGLELRYQEYSELTHDLHQIFPDEEIDLSLINHADPLFLKKIMENCQILYGDLRKLQSLKLYAFKRYQDHKRYFEMERVYADRFLKEITTQK